MIVEKVLNNNVVVSIDPNTRKEVILMGSGIAFNKKPGQLIDDKKIEKTFIVDDENLGNKIKKLINQIPEGIFEITDEIITYAIVELNVELDKQVYVSLADHIGFAVKRFKNGITIKNELLNEIRRVHRNEFKVSLWAVDYINKKLDIQLPEDEAGFIALHFVNAEYGTDIRDAVKFPDQMQAIVDIVERDLGILLDESSLHYERFMTHIKFLIQRIYRKELLSSEDRELSLMMQRKYPREYQCSVKVAEYIMKATGSRLSEEEIMYLSVHIRRVSTIDL